MTKKILLSLFLLLMVAVTIVAYHFYKNLKPPVHQTYFEAIPQNAALIVKENDFHTLFKKITASNMMWQELLSNTLVIQKINRQLQYFDSLLVGDFHFFFGSQPVLASLHLVGANDCDFVFYMPIIKNVQAQNVMNVIKQSTNKPITTRKYDGAVITTFLIDKNDKVSIINYKNTLAVSYSTALIEDVVRQLNAATSLENDPYFSKMIANSGQSEDGNLYLNHRYFAKIIHQFINKPSKQYAANMEHYSGWTELDVAIQSNRLSLNGFSFAQDKHWITTFEGQQPQEISLLTVLPFNTALLYHYGLSNAKRFFEERKRALKNTGQMLQYEHYLNKQTQKYGVDLEVELLKNVGNEMAFIITESLNDDFSNNKFVVFQTNNVEQTTTDLNLIAQKANSKPFQKFDFNGYTINKIEVKQIFVQLFGKPFLNLEQHYYTIMDEYVVFGNSEKGLKKLISNVVAEKTLENDEGFNAFSDNLSSTSSLFVYNNIARSKQLYQQFALKKHLPIYTQKSNVFQKFEALAFQVSAEKKGLYYNNIQLKYNPAYKKETASLWELALDTTIRLSPQLVLNHNTNNKEIVVQDEAHKIYLISNTGKVIWTRQLPEAIMGEVHQIDMYKNNKLQLLFNTKSNIYLIDRNGNNVANYPIKLPSNASNAVVPLDYSNSKDYRILIGCEDKLVYNYSVEGTKIKGWKYQAANSAAKGKIQHFAIANKDYIVIPLHNGKIKVVQRNGKDRLQLKNKWAVSTYPMFLKIGNTLSKTYLTAIDSTGKICKLSLNDELTCMAQEKQQGLLFNVFNFDDNNLPDYAMAYENKLKIVDDEKKVLYDNAFDAAITHPPFLVRLADKTKRLGVVAENQIYLIDPQGTVEKGFPLPGSTSFCVDDINNDKISNLVVGHGRVVYAYGLE